MEDIDEEEEEAEENKEGEENNGEKEINKEYKHKRRGKNKMHKKYSSNFLTLIIQVFVVLTILEGYFLLSYFLSLKFLAEIKDLILESGTIT